MHLLRVRLASRLSSLLGFASAVLFLILATASARAANFNVSDTASLSAAITGAGNGDTITFTASITLTSALPAVTKSVTFIGGGFSLFNATGAQAFTATAGTITLNTLPIFDDYAISGTASVTETTIDPFTIGDNAVGALTLSGGGHLTTGNANIGTAHNGTATVTGAGSLWTTPVFLTVGLGSTGDLQVLSGGKVSGRAIIGRASTGTATVSGAGSELDGNVIIGLTTGTGTLTITNGGLVDALQVDMGNAATDVAALNINSSGVLKTGQIIKNATTATIDINSGTLQAEATSTDFLSGFGAGDVTIGAGGATVDTNSFDLTFAAAIDGAGALTKQGAGTLTLNTATTYSGGTTVTVGTLALGASNVLADTGAVTVNGGTLSLGANSDTVGAVTLSSGSITSTAGALTGSSYAVTNTSGTTTVSAILAGTGALTKTGAGTLVLSGANTYSGQTFIAAGTVTLNGSLAAGSTVTVMAGSTLNGTGTINGNVLLQTGATLGSGLTVVGTVTSVGDALLVAGAAPNNLSVFGRNADGSLTPLATIPLTTSTNNVAVRGDQAFAYLTTGSPTNVVKVIDLKTFTIVQTLSTGPASDPFGIALTPDGAHAYVALHGSNQVAVYSVDTLAGLLTAQGNFGSGNGPRRLAFSSDGTKLVLANQIAGSISIFNPSTNTSTGTITTGGQFLDIALNPAGTVAYVVDVNANLLRVFDLVGQTQVTTIATGTGPRNVTVSPDGTRVYVTNLNDFTISQYDTTNNTAPVSLGTVASGFTPQGIVLNPDGRFAYVGLGGTDDQVRRFDIAAGTGLLTANGFAAATDDVSVVALATNGNRMLASGATFVATAGGALASTSTTATFTGGTLLVNSPGLTFTTPIAFSTGGGTISTNGNDATISSVISGTGAVTKSGAGTLTLSGVNTFSGGLTVSTGTLKLGNASGLGTGVTTIAVGASVDFNSASPTLTAGTLKVNGTTTGGTVTIGSGATLGGTGTLGAVTAASGGTVAPGNSIGTLNVASFTWTAGATMAWELSGSSSADLLAITGALTKSGSGTFQFNFQGGGVAGGTYTLMTFGSQSGFSASDFSITNAASGIGGGTFTLTATQLSVTLNASAPPPKSFAQLALTNLSQVYDGTAKLVTTATTPGSLFVNVTYTGNGSTQTTNGLPVMAGSYRVAASIQETFYQGSASDTLTITKATPALTWTPPAAITYGTALSAAQLNATASVAGSFNYSPASGTVPSAGTQTLRVTFTPTDSTDYDSPVTATVNLTVNKAPQTISGPKLPNQTTTIGPVTLPATSSTGAPLTYSVVSGPATIINGNQVSFTGTPGVITIQVSQAGDANTAAATDTFTFNVLAPPPSVLVNVSSRGTVASNSPLIAGFVVSGTASVPSILNLTLVRGIGPALTTFGVPGALATPTLQLFDTKGNLVLTNSSWGGGSTLTTTFTQVGAFALPPTSADAAALTGLAPGAYTIVITGASGGGIALAEVYDARTNELSGTQHLINLSARGAVAPNQPLIAGFVIAGTLPKQVLVRGVGPSLTGFGVPGALVDPQLAVFNTNNTLIAQNDNWNTALTVPGGVTPAPSVDIAAAAIKSGAFTLTNASTDAALLITLAPGAYTAVVTGIGNGAGTALVEIYEVP